MTEPLAQDDGSDRHALRWFLLALAAYVALGLAFKGVVLNWVVGPLFPLVVIGILPQIFKAQRGAPPAPLTDWPRVDDVHDPYPHHHIDPRHGDGTDR